MWRCQLPATKCQFCVHFLVARRLENFRVTHQRRPLPRRPNRRRKSWRENQGTPDTREAGESLCLPPRALPVRPNKHTRRSGGLLDKFLPATRLIRGGHDGVGRSKGRLPLGRHKDKEIESVSGGYAPFGWSDMISSPLLANRGKTGAGVPKFIWPPELFVPISGLESVRIAKTEAERLMVFRLRYRVYVERQQKLYPADHQGRIFSDELDQHGALWYSLEHGQDRIAATVRVNSGGESTALARFQEEFQLDKFLRRAAPHELHFYSRLVIPDETVPNRHLIRILARCYVMQLCCGARFTFARAAPRLIPFFKKLGFTAYGPVWNDPIAGQQACVVGLPRDVAHLRTVGSPVRHFAPEDCDDREDRLWLQRTFLSATATELRTNSSSSP
jgi:hypothetical protein